MTKSTITFQATSNTVKCTKHTLVTVDQAAELNELFTQWYRLTNPLATAVQERAALRACNWQSCQASAFEACKAVMVRDLGREARRAWAAM